MVIRPCFSGLGASGPDRLEPKYCSILFSIQKLRLDVWKRHVWGGSAFAPMEWKMLEANVAYGVLLRINVGQCTMSNIGGMRLET